MTKQTQNTCPSTRRPLHPYIVGLIASGLVALCSAASIVIISLLDHVSRTDAGTAALNLIARGILALGDHAGEKMTAAILIATMAGVFLRAWHFARHVEVR